MNVHKVEMKAVWIGGSTGYVYDVVYDGNVIVARSRVPACDTARYLLAGNQEGWLELYRGDRLAMSGDIRTLANLTVSETRSTTPRFKKWIPFTMDKEDA